MINWQYFPKSDKIPSHLVKVIEVFENSKDDIDSENNQHSSDTVLSFLRTGLEEINYQVEKSKKSIDKYIPDFPTQINLEEFFKGEDFFSKTYRLNGLNALNEIITLEVSLFKIENPQGKNQIACAIKNITNQIILEIKEKELLSQKQELASLNNEIVAQTIFVNTKNKLLNELKNDASAIIPLVQGKGKQELNRLTRKIGANINEDENFFSFKLKFEKTHPNFFKNIETIHPKLTNNDLKLCAYIRLGMTSQDIANLQFIEKRSVEMSKYRLKKKLELQGEDDLNQFINTM